MAPSSTTAVAELYRARADRVSFLDVPELAFVSVRGSGAPESQAFAEAVQALYAVSYGAHFQLRKGTGSAPKVPPLEALWWVDAADQQELVRRVAAGAAATTDLRREDWCWQAMIALPAPLDQGLVAEVIEQVRQRGLPGLARLRRISWAEGWCGQLLHVGPYADEGPSIVRLHEAITAAGYRPRGRHHEVYLGDPRRAAPERLRTILRQPVEPADGQPAVG